ncbi:MAG: LCP family protein [Anaerolineaceae bacterium]|nr:LCP family protein [Anaerolineaceae bacterium]MBN2677885.1 LCP family protein [Anaerolineaceae bacterium]
MRRSRNKNTRITLPKDGLTRILLGLFIVLGIATAIVAFIAVRYVTATQTMINLPGDPVITSSSGTAAGPMLQSEAGPTPRPWDGVNRVNLLFMGLDARDWEKGEIPRTDTMILFTIDPLTKTAGMLSIPRDLWVNIPGYDYGKINTAYYIGEVYQLPGGGPGLAVKTVEELLGVPINYYAQVDFEAFVKFIDDIGGIKVHLSEPMVLDPIGQWNTTTLEPGAWTLTGRWALAYVRARKGSGDDFGRAQRQQEAIMAIRDQILKWDQMPKMIANAPSIYADLSSGIHTNLSLDQIVQLGLLASQIPVPNIKTALIGSEQVEFETSPDGLDILRPIPDKIRIVRDEIFTTSGPVAPVEVSTDPTELMKAEKASVSIQNGTGSSGLAGRTGDYLKGLGFNVTEVGDGQAQGLTTMIIYSAKPYTAAYLAQLMNIQTSLIMNRYDPDATIDIQIILGDDWATNNQMP